MVVVIMAGGNQKRYAPKTPKQFIKIDGERIIERSIRLFKDLGSVYVIVDNEEFKYLESLGCKVVAPSEKSHELSKFMSSFDIWKDEEEVLFIYGDCYITDDCAKRIHEERPNGDFTFYGIHSEMLALWVHKTNYAKFIRATDYIKELEVRHEGGLCGSWTLYRLLLCKDLDKHIHLTNFVMINDESQDFDAERCLVEWLKNNPKHTGSII
jgi:CTP:phosphocholine cytidylyltransferase-like protein